MSFTKNCFETLLNVCATSLLTTPSAWNSNSQQIRSDIQSDFTAWQCVTLHSKCDKKGHSRARLASNGFHTIRLSPISATFKQSVQNFLRELCWIPKLVSNFTNHGTEKLPEGLEKVINNLGILSDMICGFRLLSFESTTPRIRSHYTIVVLGTQTAVSALKNPIPGNLIISWMVWFSPVYIVALKVASLAQGSRLLLTQDSVIMGISSLFS